MAYKYYNQNGNVFVTKNVIKKIILSSASDCYGVAGFCCKNDQGEARLLRGKKRLTKGIVLNTVDQRLEITLNLAVSFGNDIENVCHFALRSVRHHVEQLTGFKVGSCRANVEGILTEAEKR